MAKDNSLHTQIRPGASATTNLPKKMLPSLDNSSISSSNLVNHRGGSALLKSSSTSGPSSLSNSDDDETEGNMSTMTIVRRKFYVLSPTAEYHLPRFQYRGQDLSLLYNYILSPLAGRLVELLPKSIAPNTITLTGLLFMVSSYVFFWMYSPDFSTQPEDIPRWIFLWNCISMLLYQTFDNMDGKQARRTNSSSPLGLLFDHGCDAINSLFGSANWIIAMALHPKLDSWACWILLMGPYSLFFVGTWEEYYTGKLILPIVNGPNEGLLGGAMLSLTSYWYGSQYWRENTWSVAIAAYAGESASVLSHVRNADWVILASSIGFVQECCLKVYNVARKHGVRSLLTLVPFLTLLVCSLPLMVVNNICWLTQPRTCLHLLASLFVEMTTDLMLAHMSNAPYHPWRWILVPLVALTVVNVTSWHDHEVPMELWVWYAAASSVFLIMKSYLIIHEICDLLCIWCFDTTPRKQQTLKSD